MEKRHQKRTYKSTVALLAGAAVLLLLVVGTVVLSRRGTQNGQVPLMQVGGAEVVRVADGAELMQTLTYTRCTHTVTRRVTAPVEIYGKTLEEVQPLYPEWQITGFSATEVAMARKPDLFCPDHLVLMTGADGRLCVYRIRYGEALALEKQLESEAASLPAAAQEELAEGIGFSTEEALAGWLESMES